MSIDKSCQFDLIQIQTVITVYIKAKVLIQKKKNDKN